jgi:surface antigen
MASPVNCRALRLSPYSGTPGVRLWRARARLPLVALVLACALANSGCALSYKLDSIFGNKEGDRKDEVTGSLSQGSFAAASTADLLEGDLAYVRAAASEVLGRGGKDASAPWENPSTGARGTVTPIASAETRAGVTCRDFLASYIRAETQTWLQGEACHAAAGRWEVKSLKPLKRT